MSNPTLVDAKKLKIALISLQHDAERVPPVGLVYVATYLSERAGLTKKNIKILDINFDDIESGIERFNPDIIGFSSMTVNYSEVIGLAKRLKMKYKVPFILGGVHISTLPTSLNPIFDVGVIGEGEETMKEIVNAFIKKGSLLPQTLKKIKSTVFFEKNKLKISLLRHPISDLDSLPIPDFKFINKAYFNREEIPAISDVGVRAFIISSRGCPYRCVFCSTSRFWGRMRFHSAEFTAKIAKRMIDEFGANYLKVMDDLFTVSVNRIRDIRNAFKKYGVLENIKGIECQPRANLINEKLLTEMKKIKVAVVSFGFESGSEKMLKWLKGDNSSIDMNKKAIVLCNKYGFKVYGSLMYGSPGETIDDMRETNKFIDFGIKHGVRYMWSFVATPFPATPFWDIALERGKVGNNMDWNLLSHHNSNNPLLLDNSIDKEEFNKVFLEGRKKLRYIKLKLITEFALRNPLYLMTKLLREPDYYVLRALRQILTQ